MIKTLFIANEFPPMGGSGVQRSLKFVKYLPSFGVDPLVITKEIKGGVRDESLMADVPEGTRIEALPAYDLMHHKGLLALPMKVIGRIFLVPDPDGLWQYFNRKRVLALLDQEGIECIYTTSLPYSSHLMGLYLKRMRPNIRWVVDFRDEWTNNPYFDDMPWMRFRLPIERRLERQVMDHADYMITNTPFMLKNFVKDHPALENKSTFIPNGYDPDDFKPFDHIKNNSKRFVITYSGALYGRRNLLEIFEALKVALDSGRILLEDIELQVVGQISKDLIEKFTGDYGLGDHLVMTGYMDHHGSIKKLYESNVLLLSMGSGKGLENFYSGKVFEYIRVNRPILATVPENGAAATIIKETRTGTVVDSDNIAGITEALVAYYTAWKNGGIPHEPLWEAIESYSRPQQAKKLAEILMA